MRKKLLFILLSFIVSCLYSQEKIVDTTIYRAYYKLIYQQDSTNVDSMEEEKMTLLIGKSYSLFQSENNRFNDSLLSSLSKIDIENAQQAVDIALSLKKNTRFKFKIVKTLNHLIVFDKITTDKFIYEEKNKLKWQITNDTKLINNYLCQKATTTFGGRNYVSWFTNEIPISDGPYKFKGLPGLIIKIYDQEKHYDFELFSFKKYVSILEVNFKKAQKTSKQEYFRAYKNFKTNIAAQLEQRGIYLDDDEATKVKQRVKKTMNNEIELKFD